LPQRAEGRKSAAGARACGGGQQRTAPHWPTTKGPRIRVSGRCLLHGPVSWGQSEVLATKFTKIAPDFDDAIRYASWLSRGRAADRRRVRQNL